MNLVVVTGTVTDVCPWDRLVRLDIGDKFPVEIGWPDRLPEPGERLLVRAALHGRSRFDAPSQPPKGDRAAIRYGRGVPAPDGLDVNLVGFAGRIWTGPYGRSEFRPDSCATPQHVSDCWIPIIDAPVARGETEIEGVGRLELIRVTWGIRVLEARTRKTIEENP